MGQLPAVLASLLPRLVYPAAGFATALAAGLAGRWLRSRRAVGWLGGWGSLLIGFGAGLLLSGLGPTGWRWAAVVAIAALGEERRRSTDGRGGGLGFAAVAGALAVAVLGVGTLDAVLLAVAVAAAAVLGACLQDGRMALGRGRVLPVLYALAVAGAFLTTPDTEHVLVLLGAAAVAVLLGGSGSTGRAAAVRAGLAAAAFAWVVVVDGASRDTALVGSLACAGVLVVAPVVGRLPLARRAGHFGRAARVVVVIVQILVVLVASRKVGMLGSTGEALEAAVLLLLGAAVCVFCALAIQGSKQDG